VPAHAINAQAVLKALAEPRRADIIRLLERRHRTQTGLCRDLGMSQPLLSHHLKALRDVGLIDTTCAMASRSTNSGPTPCTL